MVLDRQSIHCLPENSLNALRPVDEFNAKLLHKHAASSILATHVVLRLISDFL